MNPEISFFVAVSLHLSAARMSPTKNFHRLNSLTTSSPYFKFDSNFIWISKNKMMAFKIVISLYNMTGTRRLGRKKVYPLKRGRHVQNYSYSFSHANKVTRFLLYKEFLKLHKILFCVLLLLEDQEVLVEDN